MCVPLEVVYSEKNLENSEEEKVSPVVLVNESRSSNGPGNSETLVFIRDE